MENRVIVERIEVGPFAANCYVVGKPGSSAFIIDPGDEAGKIKAIIKKYNFSVQFVINTHGHIDHIQEDSAFGVSVFIHEKDAPLLRSPDLNLSLFLSNPFILNDNTEINLLQDGQFLKFGHDKMEIIHTPGHTQGGVCIKFGGCLFSGDTLFCRSIGRTDFKGGSHQELIQSIKNKLFILNEDLVVFPGHGPRTTLAEEKKENPFLT
ncbi:MAG: MBL fold metallo-hydrolase [Candidatus Omnitrophica bacterium]|nr:MBL fold metallo-hydrolase [Candidatus Omnitrophota bacterium]